jgi:hypothetical protein
MEHTETGRALGNGPLPRRALGAVLAVALAASVVLALAAIGAGRDVDRASVARPLPPAPPGAVPVSVRIEPHPHGRRVPARFLGLSFEVSSLAQVAGFGASGNLVGLLRSLGPGVLRFGGVSADTRVAWSDSATPRPAWTSTVLEAGDMRRLAASRTTRRRGRRARWRPQSGRSGAVWRGSR